MAGTTVSFSRLTLTLCILRNFNGNGLDWKSRFRIVHRHAHTLSRPFSALSLLLLLHGSEPGKTRSLTSSRCWSKFDQLAGVWKRGGGESTGAFEVEDRGWCAWRWPGGEARRILWMATKAFREPLVSETGWASPRQAADRGTSAVQAAGMPKVSELMMGIAMMEA